MSRLLPVIRFALAEFGPLIVFWMLAATLGVKPAILGSILFIVVDAAWRRRAGASSSPGSISSPAPSPSSSASSISLRPRRSCSNTKR